MEIRGRTFRPPASCPRYKNSRTLSATRMEWIATNRRTLTSFGFALTLPTDVGCFKFSARPFVRAHPHFVQVRAQHSGCRFKLPVRARFFCECPVQRPIFSEDAFCECPPLAALHVRTMILLYMAPAPSAWSRARTRAAKSSHVLTMLRGAGTSLPRSFRLLQS